MSLGRSTWSERARSVALALAFTGIIGLASGCGRSDQSDEERPVEPSAEESVGSSATTPAWSMQSDCRGCHTIEAASQKDGVHLASHHADVPCVACHRNEPKLGAAHADMTRAPTKAGLDTPVDNAVCFGCHTGWEKLAELTRHSRTLVDARNRVVNPHAIPQTASHNSDPYCFVCHAMHVDERPADQYCAGCHHKNVFECYTCHESNDIVS